LNKAWPYIKRWVERDPFFLSPAIAERLMREKRKYFGRDSISVMAIEHRLRRWRVEVGFLHWRALSSGAVLVREWLRADPRLLVEEIRRMLKARRPVLFAGPSTVEFDAIRKMVGKWRAEARRARRR
jgi:hypothetical protein